MTTRAPRKPDIEHPGETDMFARHVNRLVNAIKVRFRRSERARSEWRTYRLDPSMELTAGETVLMSFTPEGILLETDHQRRVILWSSDASDDPSTSWSDLYR